MAITGYELYRVTGEYVTVDLLVWRRYKKRAPGIVEAMMDCNPQISRVHRTTPFLPVGMYVRIPIDPDLVMGLPKAPPLDIWTESRGYRL